MLGRRTSLILVLASAIALPVSVYFVQGARADLKGLQYSMRQLSQQERSVAQLESQREKYQHYVSQIQAFADGARSYGITEENWDYHQVDIKDMFLAYDQVETFVSDMSPGSNAWFIPSKAVIETQPTITRKELTKQQTEPFAGGVELTLQGEFMVER
jgi:type II secretory pathway pseudopilin PulG